MDRVLFCILTGCWAKCPALEVLSQNWFRLSQTHAQPNNPCSPLSSFLPPMAASGSKTHAPSCYKPPKNPISLNPIPETLIPNPSTSTIPPIPPSQEEIALSRASHITREQLLRRRSHLLKQLIKCYKAHYWALMEDLRIWYREYWWKYGVSPYKEEHRSERDAAGVAEGTDENNNNNNNSNYNNYGGPAADFDSKKKLQCAFKECKTKAMAMTSFCHLHILSDSKQKLYKPCSYVIKSAQAITCEKPILRSTVPSLCTSHFQMNQKNIKKALKKVGLNNTLSSKFARTFHVVLAECVRQIKVKRRTAQRAKGKKVAIKEENAD